MSTVIDRRSESKGRYITSRDRFLGRHKRQVKEAVERAIGDRKIKDIGKDGVDVTIPKEDLSRPHIVHGKGGKNERVFPGNKEYNTGDRHPKPPGGGGGGSGAGEPGDGGDGEDDFTFHLSEDEVLDIIFEDLGLPNLIKEAGEDANKTENKREGFMNEGSQNKLDFVESFKRRHGRHIALKKPLNKKKLALLSEACEILSHYDEGNEPVGLADPALDTMLLSHRVQHLEKAYEYLVSRVGNKINDKDAALLEDIDDQLVILSNKEKNVRPWNKNDQRYRRYEDHPKPVAQAVMFCLMDVSASMDEYKKNNAKLFYWLLHSFLKRHYNKVDVVFIRHTHDAEEVDEETFFYDRKTGGTIVSTSIELMDSIMRERYPLDDWNIYGAQASDGENFGDDTRYCMELLRRMLPDIQGYFYTEVYNPSGYYKDPDPMSNDLGVLVDEFPGKFHIGEINERKDIVGVFREFFQKRETYGAEAKRTAMSRYAASLAAPSIGAP